MRASCGAWGVTVCGRAPWLLVATSWRSNLSRCRAVPSPPECRRAASHTKKCAGAWLCPQFTFAEQNRSAILSFNCGHLLRQASAGDRPGDRAVASVSVKRGKTAARAAAPEIALRFLSDPGDGEPRFGCGSMEWRQPAPRVTECSALSGDCRGGLRQRVPGPHKAWNATRFSPEGSRP